MASVRARVEEHCHELAIDCACAVAVGRGNRAKMDDALKSYRANCLTKGSESTDYSAEENASWHLAGYQSIRNTLAQMAADNAPRDVTEGALKDAAAMFGQIKGEEECAQQCLALAEQARLKAICEKISRRRMEIGTPNLTDAADLEALAKQFEQIPGYKDAKKQAEQCLQDAENVRENAYNDAVKAMQEAERSSYKWREAIQKLAREGLNGYRDVEELRKQAEQRYEECVNAEEKQRQESARRKKTLTIAAVVVVMLACAIAWCIPNVIIPNNKYQQAVALREAGQYDDAMQRLRSWGITATRHSNFQKQSISRRWRCAKQGSMTMQLQRLRSWGITATRHSNFQKQSISRRWRCAKQGSMTMQLQRLRSWGIIATRRRKLRKRNTSKLSLCARRENMNLPLLFLHH